MAPLIMVVFGADNGLSLNQHHTWISADEYNFNDCEKMFT